MILNKIILFFLVSLPFLCVSAQQQKPTVYFPRYTYDLGKLSQKHPLRRVKFLFRNDGTEPLIIHEARPSCGCMTVAYTKKPIPSGQWGALIVTYNAKGYPPGIFSKTVMLTTNGKPPYYQVKIKGEHL